MDDWKRNYSRISNKKKTKKHGYRYKSKRQVQTKRPQAKEKYIVNVSERTGKPYFHRITDLDDKDLNMRTQEHSPNKEERKAYSLEEIY